MSKETIVFIDGDFPSEKGDCKHHCLPFCHPAQVGPEWVYGCLHPIWPANQEGDFCPIMNCNGESSKCKIPMELLKYINAH